MMFNLQHSATHRFNRVVTKRRQIEPLTADPIRREAVVEGTLIVAAASPHEGKLDGLPGLERLEPSLRIG